MKRRFLFMVALSLLVAGAQAAVYKWQDESGQTRYGDNPPAGAVPEPVELPEISVMPSVPQASTPAVNGTAEAEGNSAAQPYTRLAIVRPTNGQTLRTDTGRVEIAVDVRPALQSALGHRLIAFIDGNRFQAGDSGITVRAARGGHRVRFSVIDGEGAVLAQSGLVTFTIRPDTLEPFPRELRQIQGVQPVK